MKVSHKALLLVAGLVLGVLSAEIALHIVAIGLRAGGTASVRTITDATVRVLCLGESTTFCWGGDAYPVQLEQSLRARLPQQSWQVINRGMPGTNTTEILRSLDSWLDKYQPHIVVAMMGINDGLALNPWRNTGTRMLTERLARARIVRVGRWMVQTLKSAWWPQLHALPSLNATGADEEFDPMPAADGTKFIGETAAETEALQQMAVRGDYHGALDLWRRLQSAHPENPHFDFWAGWCSRQNGEPDTALAQFRNGLKKDPHCEALWFGYLFCLFEQGKLEVALQQLQAEAAARSSPFLQICRARIAGDLGRYAEREHAYARAAALLRRFPEVPPACRPGREIVARTLPALGPQNGWIYLAVAEWCFTKRDYLSARIFYEQAVYSFGRNTTALGGLASAHEALGSRAPARAVRQKIQLLEQRHVNPTLARNYRQLAAQLRRRGILLVCMSYACRDVSPLQRVLKDAPEVLFVDNGSLFRDALEHVPYEMLFTDLFAGDFGHCTAEGNRMIAENVAGVIAREFTK